jgi:ribosomal protein S8E
MDRRNQPPQERETALRKAMSLDHLKEQTKNVALSKKKKKNRGGKGPTQEHIGELKAALMSVLGDSQESARGEVKPANTTLPEQKNREQPEKKQETTQHPPHSPKPNEVSEEKLKAVLEGKDESIN